MRKDQSQTSLRSRCVQRAPGLAWLMSVMCLPGINPVGALLFPLLMAVQFALCPLFGSVAVWSAAGVCVALYAILACRLRKRSRVAGIVTICISVMSLLSGLYIMAGPWLLKAGIVTISSSDFFACVSIVYPLFSVLGSFKLVLDFWMICTLIIGWKELR